MMKILIISKDLELKNIISNISADIDCNINILDQSSDPLDAMSKVCTSNPSLLIIDDDFIKPNSMHLLKSIRSVRKDLKIIFVTSDDSIELGREISPLGIQYYAIKPIAEAELLELINTVKI